MSPSNPTGASRLKLYRDPENGRLFGVCAGIAEYTGIDVRLVRVAAVFFGLVFSWFTVVAYLVAAVMLPPRPAILAATAADEEAFWRSARTRPRQALVDLRDHLAGLERRLAGMEAEVTSPEYALRQQFRRMR